MPFIDAADLIGTGRNERTMQHTTDIGSKIDRGRIDLQVVPDLLVSLMSTASARVMSASASWKVYFEWHPWIRLNCDRTKCSRACHSDTVRFYAFARRSPKVIFSLQIFEVKGEIWKPNLQRRRDTLLVRLLQLALLGVLALRELKRT
jgi:hypothetical protein